MSEAVAARPETLADLIDSRPDLREILATNFNLAHSILLLRRGELEAVERALDLAVHQGDEAAMVVAECIRVEILRLSGDLPTALQRAEALARKERFSVMATLYFRHLFPLLTNVRPLEPVVAAAAPIAPELDEIPSQHSVVSEAADAPDEEIIPRAPSEIPSKWQTVTEDPAVLLLRLHDQLGLKERRRAEIAVGVLEEQAFTITSRILERLGFGSLRHSAFEGQARAIHTWKRPELAVAAVFETGPSSALLAARCTRAFEDHA